MRDLNLRANIARGLVIAFFINTTFTTGVQVAYAQELVLPMPGQMVALSPDFSPVVLKGIKLDPKNPFRFHFFIDSGDEYHHPEQSEGFQQEQLKQESSKLIKYFLASLTIPERDLWVNLSPYEKNRIVPQEFGQTEMGRDLLAEDYILKQITASLIYPESRLGKEFWSKVYAKAEAQYGTSNIPINTFNKVWIVPDKAVVYENNGTAFVLENHLKVMLEQDYLSLQKHTNNYTVIASAAKVLMPDTRSSSQSHTSNTSAITSQIIRQIVLPQLEHEVNYGKNFAQLRQVFYSLILATWYKKKIRESILNRVYSNRKKISNLSSPNASVGDPEHIYQLYTQAFKKGVFNYIQQEPDPLSNQMTPRKYFSGGVGAVEISKVFQTEDLAQVTPTQFAGIDKAQITDVITDINPNETEKNSQQVGAAEQTSHAMSTNDYLKGLFKVSTTTKANRLLRVLGLGRHSLMIQRPDIFGTLIPKNEEGAAEFYLENKSILFVKPEGNENNDRFTARNTLFYIDNNTFAVETSKGYFLLKLVADIKEGHPTRIAIQPIHDFNDLGLEADYLETMLMHDSSISRHIISMADELLKAGIVLKDSGVDGEVLMKASSHEREFYFVKGFEMSQGELYVSSLDPENRFGSYVEKITRNKKRVLLSNKAIQNLPFELRVKLRSFAMASKKMSGFDRAMTSRKIQIMKKLLGENKAHVVAWLGLLSITTVASAKIFEADRHDFLKKNFHSFQLIPLMGTVAWTIWYYWSKYRKVFSPDPLTREEGIEWLAQGQQIGAWAFISQCAVFDSDSNVKITAIRALWEYRHHRDTVKFLIIASRDKDPEVAKTAKEILEELIKNGRLFSDKAIQQLVGDFIARKDLPVGKFTKLYGRFNRTLADQEISLKPVRVSFLLEPDAQNHKLIVAGTAESMTTVREFVRSNEGTFKNYQYDQIRFRNMEGKDDFMIIAYNAAMKVQVLLDQLVKQDLRDTGGEIFTQLREIAESDTKEWQEEVVTYISNLYAHRHDADAWCLRKALAENMPNVFPLRKISDFWNKIAFIGWQALSAQQSEDYRFNLQLRGIDAKKIEGRVMQRGVDIKIQLVTQTVARYRQIKGDNIHGILNKDPQDILPAELDLLEEYMTTHAGVRRRTNNGTFVLQKEEVKKWFKARGNVSTVYVEVEHAFPPSTVSKNELLRILGDLEHERFLNVAIQPGKRQIWSLRNNVKSAAMKSGPGGIDLNPAQMTMQVKTQGEDFKFDFNGTEIDAAQVTGATFTIRSMTPVTNLPLELGFAASVK